MIFPHHEMTILDYNRVLRDLNGRSAEAAARRAARALHGRARRDAAGAARGAGEFGMYLAGRWYRLTLDPSSMPRRTIRSGGCRSRCWRATCIEPLFGITDQRTDKRIDFVGGGRGLGELERRVASGEMAVAFALYPTQMADLMAVADAGEIMPPKSTWFEPKLADGMVSHVLGLSDGEQRMREPSELAASRSLSALIIQAQRHEARIAVGVGDQQHARSSCPGDLELVDACFCRSAGVPTACSCCDLDDHVAGAEPLVGRAVADAGDRPR